jgi:hypothetical protein
MLLKGTRGCKTVIGSTLPFRTSETLRNKAETRILKSLFFVIAEIFWIADTYLKNEIKWATRDADQRSRSQEINGPNCNVFTVTGDAFLIVTLFYYDFTSRHYNYFFTICSDPLTLRLWAFPLISSDRALWSPLICVSGRSFDLLWSASVIPSLIWINLLIWSRLWSASALVWSGLVWSFILYSRAD